MDLFDRPGCTLAPYHSSGVPVWPPERFRGEMHVFDGLALFSQDTCAWEGVYVAKIERVQPPRFLQIVLLKVWHLSRTPLQRINEPFPNNLSKMASILAQSAGGAQAIRLGEEASKVVYSR